MMKLWPRRRTCSRSPATTEHDSEPFGDPTHHIFSSMRCMSTKAQQCSPGGDFLLAEEVSDLGDMAGYGSSPLCKRQVSRTGMQMTRCRPARRRVDGLHGLYRQRRAGRGKGVPVKSRPSWAFCRLARWSGKRRCCYLGAYFYL